MIWYVEGESRMCFMVVWVDVHGKGKVQYTRQFSIRG